jgi:hypothetical protein
MLWAKTFCAFAVLRREESRWFALPGKPRSAHAPSPVFDDPKTCLAIMLIRDASVLVVPHRVPRRANVTDASLANGTSMSSSLPYFKFAPGLVEWSKPGWVNAIG